MVLDVEMSDGTQDLFRIIGVVLVHNEEFYIRSAIENILPSCDEVLIMNHGSKDRTPVILEEIATGSEKVTVREVSTPAESHSLIEGFSGQKCWVFGVDGDEIYDPERLQVFFDSLRSGMYSEFFQIRGNVLHCAEVNEGTYEGYLAPPSRAMNKLYNFSMLESWTGGFERLHGGTQVFREGCAADQVKCIHEDHDFDESPFRCLHLVFLRRSSMERPGAGPRLNIADQLSMTFFRRVRVRIGRWLGRSVVSDAKFRNYSLGGRVKIYDPSFRLRREPFKD